MYETVFTSGLGCGKYNRCLGCQKTAKSRLEGSSGLKYTSPPQIILGNTNLQKSNLSGDLLVAPGATLQLCILTQYRGGSSRQKTLSLTSTVICNPVYTPNSCLVWKVRGAERRHAERGYVGTQDGVCGHGNRRLLTSGVSAVAVHVHGCRDMGVPEECRTKLPWQSAEGRWLALQGDPGRTPLLRPLGPS